MIVACPPGGGAVLREATDWLLPLPGRLPLDPPAWAGKVDARRLC